MLYNIFPENTKKKPRSFDNNILKMFWCKPQQDVVDPCEKIFYSIDVSTAALLPQKAESLVRDTKMYANIIGVLLKAIKFLFLALRDFCINCRYDLFDPHVGENACHVRAYILMLLSDSKPKIVSDRLLFLKGKIDELEKFIDSGDFFYKNNSCTVLELLKQENTFFYVSTFEIFLFKSYVLTFFKVGEYSNTFISLDAVSKKFFISKKAAKKLVHAYQVYLSEISCFFIDLVAEDIGMKKNDYRNVLMKRKDDSGRAIYPCFFYSKVVFTHLMNTRYPVLFLIRMFSGGEENNIIIFFEGGKQQGIELTAKNLKKIKNSISLIIFCEQESSVYISSHDLVKKINFFGLSNILSMNTAAHPQFSGSRVLESDDEILSNSNGATQKEKALINEFCIFRENAEKYGFCKNNQELLSIKHIYSDLIYNQYYRFCKEDDNSVIID